MFYVITPLFILQTKVDVGATNVDEAVLYSICESALIPLYVRLTN